jgi:hypothetical protein
VHSTIGHTSLVVGQLSTSIAPFHQNELSNHPQILCFVNSTRRSRDNSSDARFPVSRLRPSYRLRKMVAITNACTEWIVFGQVELDKDNAATIDVMRRALLPSNACVPALPVRGCWCPDSDI